MSKVNYNKPPPWPKDYDLTNVKSRINANLNILDLNARPLNIKDRTVQVTVNELEFLVREVEDLHEDEFPTDKDGNVETRISAALNRLDLNARPIHEDETVTVTVYELGYLVRQVSHDDWA